MKQFFIILSALVLISLVPNSCVTKKKKSETGAIGKFYHNTTSYYNGYWNANEILKESMKTLRTANVDDYNNMLEVEDFISVDNPKMVKGEMDKIIEKVTTVAQLHEPSDWVDDCYVMMAKAQYLKQEYETAEETLEYFQEDFNPANPYGRNYKSRKPTGKAAKKAKKEADKAKVDARQKEREKKQELRDKEAEEREIAKKELAEQKKQDAKIAEAKKEATAKAREEEKKVKEAEKKAAIKAREEEKKQKEKERERLKKEKERQRKEDAKNRKKGIRTKKSVPKPEEAKPEETKIEASPEIADTKSTKEQTNVTNDQVIVATTAKTENKELPKEESKPIVSTKVAKPEQKKEEAIFEEPVEAPKPKKPEEDKTAYSEGLLWLAKTYIKRENWFAAEMLLQKLEKGAVSDDIKSDLPATYANLYIKQKKYGDAIAKLNQAIEEENDKQLKSRYAYITGQIYQLGNQSNKALEYFSLAKKYARSPKMEFMSELAMAKTALGSGSRSKESVLSDLKKMLSDTKNSDVKDQIYFTIGEIEVSQNNTDEAIDNFVKSIANNSRDQKLKAETYFKIAGLHYDAEKYLEASNYFDTTLTLIQRTDIRYVKVQKLVANLKDIASNLETINNLDSLLYFVTLSDEEKIKVIPPYIERNKKQTPNVGSGNLVTKQLFESASIDFGNSSFFAYNKNTKAKGKEDFEKVWERRPLEDDWRRSSKVSNGFSQKEDNKVAESNGKDVTFNREEYEKFLRELPSNPIKKQETNEHIMNAMFTLGKLFRDKIENYSKSASTLEDMHSRFGATPFEQDSYFYLYLDYTDLGNSVKANEYKSELLKKYPQSSYAGIISDPDYFNKSSKKSSKPDEFYKAVFALYERGNYSEALEFINKSSESIGDNHNYHAKIALLKAMCIGGTSGKDAYIKSLNEVVSGFPNTPEYSKAKEIMRFLGGDQTAFETVTDVDKIYQREANTTHYIAVVTYNLEEVQYVNLKVAVSEYNKKNFKTERLQLGDASLNIELNTQIILIRKFENEDKALDYYKKVIKDRDEFSGNAGYTYDVMVISQANYRKMLSERTSTTYRAYFESNILRGTNK